MTDAERAMAGEADGEGWDPGLQAQVTELNTQLLEHLRQRAQSPAAAAMLAPPAFAGIVPLPLVTEQVSPVGCVCTVTA